MLFDSSIWVARIRYQAYNDVIQREVRHGRAWLSSVVLQELYAGTRSLQDRRDVDRIRQAFAMQDRILTPTVDEWALAGLLLARYSRWYGTIKPSDHLPDVLIAVSTSSAGLPLVTENDQDMRVWQTLLAKHGRRLKIIAVRRT
ncbi:MAG: PIN domain-containing protein [Candidatus Methylomirabilis oxyfera]|nr:PIN domain-containing protein [Candidatus Methylomirabilis oxyfera]